MSYTLQSESYIRKRIIRGTCFHSLITTHLLFPVPPQLTVFHSDIFRHHAMYCFDLTDADITAELWPDLVEVMTGSSNTSVPQGAHEDSIIGYPSTSNNDLLDFNARNDTAFTPIPTTSMGTFTTQSNYSSYLVSKQQLDRRH